MGTIVGTTMVIAWGICAYAIARTVQEFAADLRPATLLQECRVETLTPRPTRRGSAGRRRAA